MVIILGDRFIALWRVDGGLWKKEKNIKIEEKSKKIRNDNQRGKEVVRRRERGGSGEISNRKRKEGEGDRYRETFKTR